jgi:hypothetical protein
MIIAEHFDSKRQQKVRDITKRWLAILPTTNKKTITGDVIKDQTQRDFSIRCTSK